MKTTDEDTHEPPREAALIAALADIIERTCVIEQRTVVQSTPPQTPAKAA